MPAPAVQPILRNSATLAPGHDPETTYVLVNGRQVSIAALLDMDAAASITVHAYPGIALTTLDLHPTAAVYAYGCPALTVPA